MFRLGGSEHALVQEWQGLHSIRYRIIYLIDSIKASVMLHPNQAVSVATCMKGANAT